MGFPNSVDEGFGGIQVFKEAGLAQKASRRVGRKEKKPNQNI